MSLFGEFPDDPPASKQKSSLFNEPSSHERTSSGGGLFNDGDDDAGWGLPTPKKQKEGRRELIRRLLEGVDVPEVYVDVFDGLAPEKRNVDGVLGEAKELDEDAENLPIPDLGSLTAKKEVAPPSPPAPVETTPHRPAPHSSSTSPTAFRAEAKNMLRKPSFGLEADPWASPDLHRGHNHGNGKETGTNGFATPSQVPASSTWQTPDIATISQTPASLPQRTTSAFTTHSNPRDSTSSSDRAPIRPAAAGDAGWGGYTGTSSQSFGSPARGNGGGYDGQNDRAGNNAPPGIGRTNSSAPRPVAPGVEETITITSISEKEGLMFFQHRNYEVVSARRNSKVIRRYSDFVWLLDCLHKRYPFRQLPLLPPKRVAINGNYLAADATFVEKRRRGLVRFANALVHHPVLSQEQLVIMFLTVPTELSVWRKQANLSVVEEFKDKALPPGLEDSLAPDLQDLFDRVRSGVRRSSEIYINLCNMLERLVKRNEGMASENYRFSRALEACTEATSDTYAVDTNDVPMLNEGLNAAAKHMSSSQALLEDEARAWDEGVLEDMKRQRDCLVSVRDMFDRRDRYDKDNIPSLEKRIDGNTRKLEFLRERTEGVKPGDVEKVEDAIHRDKLSIVAQHARHVFIRQCIRDEIHYFQGSQYAVSKLHQEWAQERVKYAELQADCWRGLADSVEAMPVAASE
ncbi:Sorting nexin mvp1 [Venturia nashicola]|nr:Sorting nexin mvp1 [Venturia nashicola]